MPPNRAPGTPCKQSPCTHRMPNHSAAHPHSSRTHPERPRSYSLPGSSYDPYQRTYYYIPVSPVNAPQRTQPQTQNRMPYYVQSSRDTTTTPTMKVVRFDCSRQEAGRSRVSRQNRRTRYTILSYFTESSRSPPQQVLIGGHWSNIDHPNLIVHCGLQLYKTVPRFHKPIYCMYKALYGPFYPVPTYRM